MNPYNCGGQDKFDALLETQRDYFRTGATLPVSFRVEMLKKLRAAVAAHEEEIVRALKEDLGKGAYESYMCGENASGPVCLRELHKALALWKRPHHESLELPLPADH